MPVLPDRRLAPRASLLLSGATADDVPRHPGIAWPCEAVGGPEHRRRVWRAHGLLHLGPARPSFLGHDLRDPAGLVDALMQDPSLQASPARARAAAWHALRREDAP